MSTEREAAMARECVNCGGPVDADGVSLTEADDLDRLTAALAETRRCLAASEARERRARALLIQHSPMGEASDEH